MCFSVTASFTASLALITCGIAALKYAQEKKLIMIATIPFIFGLQQCAEGFVWLSFLNPRFEFIRMPAAYIFLLCAGIIWPLWMPLSIAYFEGIRNYKRYVPSLIAGGICAITSVLYVSLYNIVVQEKCNIVYNFDFSHAAYVASSTYVSAIMSLLYIVATIIPCFIVRNKTLWFIGTLIAVAYVVSYVAYFEAFTSVWCFFAALISILVYVFVYDQRYHSVK